MCSNCGERTVRRCGRVISPWTWGWLSSVCGTDGSVRSAGWCEMYVGGSWCRGGFNSMAAGVGGIERS